MDDKHHHPPTPESTSGAPAPEPHPQAAPQPNLLQQANAAYFANPRFAQAEAVKQAFRRLQPWQCGLKMPPNPPSRT